MPAHHHRRVSIQANLDTIVRFLILASASAGDPSILGQLVKRPAPAFITSSSGNAIWLGMSRSKIKGRSQSEQVFTLCTKGSLELLRPLLGLDSKLKCSSLTGTGIYLSHKAPHLLHAPQHHAVPRTLRDVTYFDSDAKRPIAIPEYQIPLLDYPTDAGELRDKLGGVNLPRLLVFYAREALAGMHIKVVSALVAVSASPRLVGSKTTSRIGKAGWRTVTQATCSGPRDDGCFVECYPGHAKLLDGEFAVEDNWSNPLKQLFERARAAWTVLLTAAKVNSRTALCTWPRMQTPRTRPTFVDWWAGAGRRRW